MMGTMLVKQIDLKEALRLAAKGMEIKVLVPTGPGIGWESLEPDTIQNMLADVLFFRDEPAMSDSEFEQAVETMLAPPVEESGDPGMEDRPSVDGRTKRAKKIDTGKLLALHKAGWRNNKIAEELGVAPSTVYIYLKKMEDKHESKAHSTHD